MKKLVVALFLIPIMGLISCTDKKEIVVDPNESYTVVKENGEEKVVSKDTDETIINAGNLPEKSNQFLKNNFGSETIQNVVKEANINGDEYKVQLSNGVKVDFDANGDWKQVEAGIANQSVGALFLPQITRDYLNKNYPEIGIKSIDKDEKGIDIELLQNNVDLKFDTNGKFLKID